MTIQKRAAYFGCIAALDGNSEALALSERPFSSWPASPAPPRWSRARSGGVERRRRTGGWTGCRAVRQSRPQSVVATRGLLPCADLATC